MKKETIKKAFLASLPVMAGYIVLGIAFGILLSDKGYGAGWALLMSSCVFAGSMQFVGVDLIAGGAGLVSTAIMTVLVNARHLIYGISMLEKYKNIGKTKPYLIFGLTDETFALVVNGNPEGTDKKTYYFFCTLLDQCYWVLGSVLGSLIGALITFDTTGIDFAMTALFVVIFTEQLISSKDKLPAAIGVGVTLACRLFFGSQNFLIPAILFICAGLTIVGFVRKESKKV